MQLGGYSAEATYEAESLTAPAFEVPQTVMEATDAQRRTSFVRDRHPAWPATEVVDGLHCPVSERWAVAQARRLCSAARSVAAVEVQEESQLGAPGWARRVSSAGRTSGPSVRSRRATVAELRCGRSLKD